VNRQEKEDYLREYSLLKAKGKPFFPYAVVKDGIMACVVMTVIILMSLILGAELVGPPLLAAGIHARGLLGDLDLDLSFDSVEAQPAEHDRVGVRLHAHAGAGEGRARKPGDIEEFRRADVLVAFEVVGRDAGEVDPQRH